MSIFERLYKLSENDSSAEIDKIDDFQHQDGPLIPYGAEEARHNRIMKGCLVGCAVMLLTPFALAKGCEAVDRRDNPPQPTEAETACRAEVHEQTPKVDDWAALLNELGKCTQTNNPESPPQ